MRIFDRRTGRPAALVIRWKLIGKAAMDERERFETQRRRDMIVTRVINSIAADLDTTAMQAAEAGHDTYEEVIKRLEDAVGAMFFAQLSQFCEQVSGSQSDCLAGSGDARRIQGAAASGAAVASPITPAATDGATSLGGGDPIKGGDA